MADRILRDPMTLDEERRAVLHTREVTAHCLSVREFSTPGLILPHLTIRPAAIPYIGNEPLERYAGAILSGDCGNER